MMLHLKIHRLKHIPLILIAVWFILSPMTNGNAGMDMNVIIRKMDNGKEITLKSGDTFRIELDAPGVTGYTWEFDNLDADYFELLKEETAVMAKEGYAGAPVLTTWHLKSKEKEGKTEIHLFRYRPWEGKSKAIDTFMIKVIIVK